jgi:3-phenylpropionate/trans-cinnamate dioxygenase ferredoxin reductase component
MQSTELNRVVVVGGSVAALTAIQALRMEGFDGHITMLGDEAVAPYTRVPLSKERLAGTVGDDELSLAAPSDADVRLGVPAIGLDPIARVVRTAGGDIPYDGLVIATGARPRRLAPHLDELVLRQLTDCHLLSKRLESARSLLIVGGGFLGMEVASTASALGLDVTVVSISPPLDRMLGSVVAERVRGHARANNVRIHVSPAAVDLIGTGRDRSVAGVRMGDGRAINADVVLTAAGDVPNTGWLADGGIPLSRGAVIVDDRCKVAAAGVRNVVAAGDVAVTRYADGLEVKTATWTNAIEQARAAALALMYGGDAAPYRQADYFWTHQFGLDIKLVGASGPAGAPTTLEDDAAGGGSLLVWRSEVDGGGDTAIAFNHPIRPVMLRRMLAARP